jgi:hypothetical protein
MPLRRFGEPEQSRGVPVSPGRPWHALSIEVAHDGEWTLARGVLVKDAPYDHGLVLVDGSAAAFITVLENVIAVALTAGDAAGLHPADLPAACLLGQVLQEQRRHRAFEADVDLRHGTVGERLDAHAEELQSLVERRDVGLAARQTVQALGNDDVELAGLRVRDQPQDSGPVQRRSARDGGVIVDLNDVEAARLRVAPRKVNLIGNRTEILQVA